MDQRLQCKVMSMNLSPAGCETGSKSPTRKFEVGTDFLPTKCQKQGWAEGGNCDALRRRPGRGPDTEDNDREHDQNLADEQFRRDHRRALARAIPPRASGPQLPRQKHKFILSIRRPGCLTMQLVTSRPVAGGPLSGSYLGGRANPSASSRQQIHRLRTLLG